MKQALISVSDKRGIVELAKELVALGFQLLSTGGTALTLQGAGLPVKEVSSVTGFPECLEGRVKTLHPAIHGGLLARRDQPSHMETLAQLKIDPIDLVVINLYPFKETILKEGITHQEAIEQIDIGGPAMLRSAAKNYQDVTVVVDPKDYERVLKEIRETGNTTLETRRDLAKKVFQHTSHYDTLIATYLDQGDALPETLTVTFEKVQDLRYGENPHQKAAFYREVLRNQGTLADGIQLQGKELSFNNINDADGALQLVKEFEAPTVVAVKHTNPCGVASGETILEAYQRAYEADPQSIFGGIVAANRPVDGETARLMNQVFLEIVIAPGFTPEALEIFKEKKNLRLIQIEGMLAAPQKAYDYKRVAGGLLVQKTDGQLWEELKVVTERTPSEAELADLMFAFKVVKHMKSNAIALVKDQQTVALGPGQTSRIWALENAIRQGGDKVAGSVMASDAFFPFDDCVEAARKAGVTAIIQPGGSVRDQDSIEAANRANIAMIFTGTRHFKH